MSLLCVAVCALCIVSGLGYDIGPLHGTVDFGTMYPKHELTPQDIEASNKLIGLLELVRKMMAVGIDDIVPPLDPYVKGYMMVPAIFRRPDSDLQGSVRLSNLVASGAQDFIMNKCEVQRNKMIIDIDVTVPHLVADIDYATTNFAYKNFIFNTSGHAQFVLKNLRIKGGVSFYETDDEKNRLIFFPMGFHADYYAEDVQIDQNIEYIPVNVINEVKDALLNSVGHDALGQVGKIMGHFSVEQVINFLYGNSAQWYYYFESPRNI